MIYKNQTPQELFKLFCAISSSMIEIAGLLRSKSDVSEILQSTDIRAYQETLVFETYVDAEAKDGPAFSWGFELRYEQELWIVEAALRKSHRDGQDILQEFPELRTESFEELIDGAIKATHWLVESAKSFNVADCRQV